MDLFYGPRFVRHSEFISELIKSQNSSPDFFELAFYEDNLAILMLSVCRNNHLPKQRETHKRPLL